MWSPVLNCSQEEIVQPVVPERKKLKDHKRQQEVEKKEQKERLKKENEYRKKFKVSFCAKNWKTLKNVVCITFLLWCEKCTLLIFEALQNITKYMGTHFKDYILDVFMYSLSLHIIYRRNTYDFIY